jgi:tetratricopeptide (TPR) repeat protein
LPPKEIFVRTYDTKTADAKTVLSTPQSYRPVPVNVTPDEDATETTTTTTATTTTTKVVSTGPRLGVEKPIDPRCQPFVTRGVQLMSKASYEPAIKEFSEALKLDPESVPIRRYLAAALVANNLPSQAVDQIQIIFKQVPATAYDKNLIGQAYLLQNKNLEAIGAYMDALKIDPAFDTARGGLARAYAHQGNFPESFKTINQGMELIKVNKILTAVQKKGWLDFYRRLMQEIADLKNSPDPYQFMERGAQPAQQAAPQTMDPATIQRYQRMNPMNTAQPGNGG